MSYAAEMARVEASYQGLTLEKKVEYCIRYEDTRRLTALIAAENPDFTTMIIDWDRKPTSPLLAVIEHQSSRIMQVLLTGNIDVKQPGTIGDQTIHPLIFNIIRMNNTRRSRSDELSVREHGLSIGRRLIDAECELNVASPDGATPLLELCSYIDLYDSYGHALYTYLLNHGADPNFVAPNTATKYNGIVSILNLLIDYTFTTQFNKKLDDFRRAYRYSRRTGTLYNTDIRYCEDNGIVYVDIARMFHLRFDLAIERGADVRATGRIRFGQETIQTNLLIVALNKIKTVLSYNLDVENPTPALVNHYFTTLLERDAGLATVNDPFNPIAFMIDAHSDLFNTTQRIIQLLIENGADVNGVSAQTRMSPLVTLFNGSNIDSWSARSRLIPLLTSLLTAGADFRVKHEGKSLLELGLRNLRASDESRKRILFNFFLTNGLLQEDDTQIVLNHLPMLLDHRETRVDEERLAAFLTPDRRNNTGQTALSFVLRSGNIKALAWLLNHGHGAASRNIYGTTIRKAINLQLRSQPQPVKSLARGLLKVSDTVPVAEFLAEYGLLNNEDADWLIKNSKGVFQMNERYDSILLPLFTDKPRNETGATLLHKAMRIGNTAAAQWLTNHNLYTTNKNIYGYSAANLGKASHQQPYPQHVADLVTIQGQRPRTFRNTQRNEYAAAANARRRALGVGGRRKTRLMRSTRLKRSTRNRK